MEYERVMSLEQKRLEHFSYGCELDSGWDDKDSKTNDLVVDDGGSGAIKEQKVFAKVINPVKVENGNIKKLSVEKMQKVKKQLETAVLEDPNGVNITFNTHGTAIRAADGSDTMMSSGTSAGSMQNAICDDSQLSSVFSGTNDFDQSGNSSNNESYYFYDRSYDNNCNSMNTSEAANMTGNSHENDDEMQWDYGSFE